MSQILQIASSAMRAMRAALEVSSQNVSNAQTTGYIRQRAALAPLSAGDFTDPNASGSGVTVEAIQRLRDQCLEAQINHQEGQLGEQQAQADSLSRLQSTFGDVSSSGLTQALGAFFNAVETLQTNPESAATRSQVTSAADTFASQSREASAQLTNENATIEEDLTQNVSQINDLLHQVADLNAKIMPLGDGSAGNDLRVSREQDIRQLATLCGATGLDQANHSQDVLIGGVRLVEGSHVTELSLVPDPANPTQHVVVAGGTQQLDSLGGKVAGDLAARSQGQQWQQSLDSLVSTFADAANTVHRAGYDLHGNAGGGLFTYDSGSPAASLQVSSTLLNNPDLLAVSSTASGAPGDATNAQKLLDLRDAQLMSGGTTTVEESYRQLLSAVGLASQRTTEAQTSRQQLVNSLDAQYSQESGVSLDDESVDIMRYQQVFNASLKLVKMADDMMQGIINLAN